MARILVSAFAIAVVSLVVGTNSIAAERFPPGGEHPHKPKTHEETVPTERVISIEPDPSAPDDRCSIVIFYQWDNVPGTVSATIKWTNLTNGQEMLQGSAPPFNDIYTTYNPDRFAPTGTHWVAVGFGSAAGAGAGDNCEERRPELEAGTSSAGTAVLTVEGEGPPTPRECRKARGRAKEAGERVRKLKKFLRKKGSKKNGPSKDEIRERLDEAKEKYAEAKEAAKAACPD